MEDPGVLWWPDAIRVHRGVGLTHGPTGFQTGNTTISLNKAIIELRLWAAVRSVKLIIMKPKYHSNFDLLCRISLSGPCRPSRALQTSETGLRSPLKGHQATAKSPDDGYVDTDVTYNFRTIAVEDSPPASRPAHWYICKPFKIFPISLDDPAWSFWSLLMVLYTWIAR